MKQAMFSFSLALLAGAASSVSAYDARIIGGTPVSIESRPWMVGLVSKDAANTDVFCGASLIAAQWVLTAAHCLASSEEGTLDIIAGTANLGSVQAERISVDDIVVHPDYDHYTLKNDIALLKLSKSSAQRTIAYKVPLGIDRAGAPVNVTGWGNLSSYGNQYPTQLHAVDLSISEFSACNAAYGGSLSRQQLCASSQGGTKDSCQGDSGGPLVAKYNDADVQLGIVSFGRECASATHPGVYTRVASYQGFIDATLNAAATVLPPEDQWADLIECLW